MKKPSEVFKSIRYAKVTPRDTPHKSTDDEEHGTVGEKEFEDQVKHVKKMAGMSEEVKDKSDEGEYDREGDMAKSDLRSIVANAQKLHDMIDDADNLPEWCQSKITLAEDYVSTVANYMTAEMNEETDLNEVSSELLGRYKEKAKKSAEELTAKGEHKKSTDRWMNVMKATGKQIGHTVTGIRKALNREEVEQVNESDLPITTKKQKTVTLVHKTSGKEIVIRDTPENRKNYAKMDFHPMKEEVEWKPFNAKGSNPVQKGPEQQMSKAKPGYADSLKKHIDATVKRKMEDEKQGRDSMSGRSYNEGTEKDVPFEGPYTKKPSVVTDKSGAKHGPMSIAKHLAKQAMKKQAEKMKPVKESLDESRKAEIVKEIAKKKKVKNDNFEANPTLTSQIVKEDK